MKTKFRLFELVQVNVGKLQFVGKIKEIVLFRSDESIGYGVVGRKGKMLYVPEEGVQKLVRRQGASKAPAAPSPVPAAS